MRWLNLYGGIGGNRKLWQNVEVTMVELNPAIAAIYKDLFPNDEVIVADAHEYLLEHYLEFDGVWSSPPCPTHSKTMFFNHIEKRYPDWKLWQEIIFLQHFAKGLWVVENVQPYYKSFIQGKEIGRHLIWCNFGITNIGESCKVRNDKGITLEIKMEERNIIVKDWHGYVGDKRQVINNCVDPQIGLHVFNAALNSVPPMQDNLFVEDLSKKYV